MKKVVAVGVLVLGLALAGCGASGAAPDGKLIPLASYEIVLKDGRTVACVTFQSSAVSCDWAGAK